MRPKKNIKLSLNKSTVAHLDDMEMGILRGGFETGSVCKSVEQTMCETCMGFTTCTMPSRDPNLCSSGTVEFTNCDCM